MVGNVGSGDGVLVVQYVDELTTEPVKHTVMTCVVMIVVPPFDSVSVFFCTCVVVIVTWPRSESVFVVLEPLVVTDGGTAVVREELVGLGLPELLPVPLDDWIEMVLEPLFVELPLDDDEMVSGVTELLPVPLVVTDGVLCTLDDEETVEPLLVELLPLMLNDEEETGITELLTVPDDKVEPVFVELLTVPLDDETVLEPLLVELPVDDEEVAGIPELLLETQPGSVRRALIMSLEL